jgi:hypothetical protein
VDSSVSIVSIGGWPMAALPEIKYTCISTKGSSDSTQQYLKTVLVHKRKMWLLLFQKSTVLQFSDYERRSYNY